jgi:hypothetical protein
VVFDSHRLLTVIQLPLRGLFAEIHPEISGLWPPNGRYAVQLDAAEETYPIRANCFLQELKLLGNGSNFAGKTVKLLARRSGVVYIRAE